MNQNNNQNKEPASAPKGYGVAKEEKDFLAREEVKTMEKDISKLREIEAHRERERVSRIKTEEEIIKEKEREQLAQKASLERDLAEKEAREREERIRKMREAASPQRASEPRPEESGRERGKEEERAEGFKSALKETQTKEEELRKRFLARVEARAEGKPASAIEGYGEAREEIPFPATPLPEIAKTFLKKPGFGQKLWIRIVLALLAVTVLAGVATLCYWYFVLREAPPEPEEPVQEPPNIEEELVIPPALFYVENSQTVTAPLFSQTIQEPIDQGSIKRIAIEDVPRNQVFGLKEFFDFFSITTPENFYDKVANDFTLFVYSQEEGNRVGLVVKINDEEGLADLLSSWESTMKSDSENFFDILGYDQSFFVPYFKNATYQETSFRFQTFSLQDVGLVYATYNDYFILTTSWKGMEKALDRLKEAPMSLFFSPNSGAEFVLENMGLEGKIGQLFFIGINGTTFSPETEKLIASVQPGGILLLKKNIIDGSQTRKLVQDLQQASLKNYGIPLFIGVDQEGGEISPVSFIQEKTAQSEIKTAEQAYAVGLSRGEELKDLGINLNLAPVLDTAQPGDFVFSRAFQATDPESRALAKALISGQKTASILTAVKHFPGYGDIAFNPEDKLATLEETPQVSLFETAAEAKPEFVMTSNVIYAEIDAELPFSFSQKGIKLLKESVGSEPLIITDDLPQPSLIDKFSLKGVVTLPVKAGADILTFSTNWETTLPEAARILDEAVRSGEISQTRIDDSVLKIIKLKKAYYGHEPH